MLMLQVTIYNTNWTLFINYLLPDKSKNDIYYLSKIILDIITYKLGFFKISEVIERAIIKKKRSHFVTMKAIPKPSRTYISFFRSGIM